MNTNDRAQALLELYLGGGWLAGLGVAADGSTWPWLLAPDDNNNNLVRFPAHELTGPLPPPYTHRLRQPLRCGAPTKAGTPCRITAGYCRWHRSEATP